MPVAMIVLLSQFNYESFSRVYHAATVIMMLAIASARDAPLQRASLQVALGALVAAYFRPELFMAFILLLALWAWGVKRDLRYFEQTWKWQGMALAMSLFLILYLGVPVSGGRGVLAFSEHYALNVVGSRGAGEDAWGMAQSVFREGFGEAESVAQAALANPEQFIWHIGRNIRRAPIIFVSHLSLHVTPYVPGYYLLIIAVVLWVSCTGRLQDILQRVYVHRRIVAIIAVLLAVSLISVVLIYPRRHYLILPSCVTVFLVSLLYAPRVKKTEDALYACVLGICIVGVIPVMNADPRGLPIKSTVVYLNDLDASLHHRVASDNTRMAVYLGPHIELKAYDSHAELVSMLDGNLVDIVVLTGNQINESVERNIRDELQSRARRAEGGVTPLARTDVLIYRRRH